MAIRLLSFLLCFLCSLPACSQLPLVLDSGMQHVELSPYASLLRDASGTMTIDDVVAARAEVPLQKTFNAGFTKDALWVRIEITGNEGHPHDWILEVNNAVMDDVRLYGKNKAEGWKEWVSGEDIPRSRWPVQYRNPAFRINLKEPGPHTFWLRIASRNSISAQLSLWAPDVFSNRARDEYLAYGLLFGTYAMIIVFYLFFWISTGEIVSGWYTIYVANSLFQMLISFGFLQEHTGLPGRITDHVLAFLICSSIWIGARLSAGVLELPRVMPRLNRYLVGAATAGFFVTISLVAVKGYAAGVGLAQIIAATEVLFIIGISTYLWYRGHRPAGLYLLAFGLFCAGILVRVMRNFTLLPPNFATDNGFQIGAVLHMLVMSMVIMDRYNAMKAAAGRAQAEALRVKAEREAYLNVEIKKRTASLTQEITRRESMEIELRQSLDVEKQARQEQLDFVAMVSHEFRTPLAIIDTCAQRILGTVPSAITQERCSHIREASYRMTRLMDEFLSLDRINGDLRAFSPREEEIEAIVQKAVSEWHPGSIEVTYVERPQSVLCDTALLHVALRNLLANAIRHSPQDSSVHLRISVHEERAVKFEILNSGQEIPADEIPKLFQKYFRGRGAQGSPGSGLGLYLVERVAKLHNGSVSVLSSQEGSCFSLIIGEA
ncbi:His Kinase A (phospho-acceptor) domain-containing protein [Formivibrio citricus]|uniref:histidine kinase n=1 Tax=Formivibrio citricus TaxID=83765 RepID=A0A1I4V3G4_9NEIS|nr:sensor histidine kinase [Formivibrio citricus]SFM95661.1 His Kinase A (phospho-acceptor) domain-containing protein [Formivibrio citricus]